MSNRVVTTSSVPAGTGLVTAVIIGGKKVHDDIASLITGIAIYAWYLRRMVPFVIIAVTGLVMYWQVKPGHLERPIFWAALVLAVVALLCAREAVRSN